MPKTIFTEQDIEAMKARGATSIEVTEDVILTDLAIERTHKYGLKINRTTQAAPQATFSPSVNTYAAYSRGTLTDSELKQRIKSAVLARLNGQVDNAVLDATIARVMQRMG